jgi:hypothetical protein
VLAPWGVLEDPGTSPLGAPWGHESDSRSQRAAAAINAGVDQFGGLNDPTPITDARTANLITDAQLGVAAGRALALAFRLGLFENPYVDPSVAQTTVSSNNEDKAAADAYERSLVLLVNATKPAGWLNGNGDGSQSGDPGNAGNGTGKVLPAPPGRVYYAHGAAYYIGSGFNLDAIRSHSADYGELTNDETTVGCDVCTKCDASTTPKRIACSDYYFIRIPTPVVADPDSGPLSLPQAPLSWADNGLSAALAEIQSVKDAMAANPGSKTQIIVGLDAGRLPILDEILAFGVSGVYLEWMGPGSFSDEHFFQVAYGFVPGVGKLPTGLPLSDAAVQSSMEDVAGDGQNATCVRGFGLTTPQFQ